MDRELVLEVFEGVADTDGLDSFAPEGKLPHMVMNFRCRMNSHRRPIIYRAYLTPSDARIIETIFRTKPKLALIELKQRAKVLEAAGRNVQEHWDSLPDFKNNEFKTPIKPQNVQQLELDLEEF